MSAPVRSVGREHTWRQQTMSAALRLIDLHPEKSQEIEAELTKQLESGPDFTRYRRGSAFADAPQNNVDRNFLARIMFIADTIERRSWRNRSKGKHGGALGRTALTLLRVLLFVVKKSKGRLAPSYAQLARLCRLSRRAVVTAMEVLKRMGFITVHRRCQRIRTALGVRVVQDNNAYEYHLPTGWGALAWSIYRPASECTKCPATAVREENPLSSPVKPLPFGPVSISQWALERGSEPLRAAPS